MPALPSQRETRPQRTTHLGERLVQKCNHARSVLATENVPPVAASVEVGVDDDCADVTAGDFGRVKASLAEARAGVLAGLE